MNVALLITLTDDGKDGATACLEECQRQTEALTATGGYSFTTFLNDEGVGGYQKRLGKGFGDRLRLLPLDGFRPQVGGRGFRIVLREFILPAS